MLESTLCYSPAELAAALGLFPPTTEQAAVIAAPPGPVVVIAGAGAGKTETMAARVVWLIANGYAAPDQVLGLTFTRKAAGQLLRRVRSRLDRLAEVGLGRDLSGPAGQAVGTPSISTYHAFAGSLLRDHGLLFGIEPDIRLLSETELWQLAGEVVNRYDGELYTDKTPAAVTSMVLRLRGQLAEHLVDTCQLRDIHAELERLVLTLPAGPRQREGGPSQWLLRMLTMQQERAELVPLLDALDQRMTAEKVMDFGLQMGLAARLAAACPEVGAGLRERYRVVLLDEYQDTGYAQRVALSSLFGGGCDDQLALTAVGDPIQSIYGWRGASATNLPRFCTDFPLSDGTPAPVLELMTSWRNPPTTLHVANAVSAEARQRSVGVRALSPRPGAPSGTVRCALLADVCAEREWIAEQLHQRYQQAWDNGVDPPTAAILMRRNADSGPMADVLRARGIPAEVVGLSGLLSIPEVAQVVETLRLLADPTAGPAAMQTLIGPRWRLGARDIAALWRRASVLAGEVGASLVDAIADPGPAEQYSTPGYQRISTLAGELGQLRKHLGQPLPDLVAEIRRVLGIDCEVRAAAPACSGWTGTEHLEAFAEVVAGYAARAGTSIAPASVAGLLAYLDAAAVIEKGLPPAQVAAGPGRVQILTTHAAKGLEWQVVAVAHLSAGVFPSTGSARTWLTDAGELPPLLRGDRAEEGAPGIPVLDMSDVFDRKQLSDKISAHRQQLEARRIDEERRLLYVAITRAEDTLLLSGYHWGTTGAKPRGPSDFLHELKDVIERAGDDSMVVEQWAQAPPEGSRNPLRESAVEAVWPDDPIGARRGDIERGAALVSAAMATDFVVPEDVWGWSAEVEALLAEHASGEQLLPAQKPQHMSVSGLVELARGPGRATALLGIRQPSQPQPHALLGNAFHAWIQDFYGVPQLFELDDASGFDTGLVDTEELAALQAAFIKSPWASRSPIAVEVPFEMPISHLLVRGRIDAVFADADGGVTVVDWKTGEPPVGAQVRRQAAVQLGVYRLAWAALVGCPEDSVRTAFHYVRAGITMSPETLPGSAELADLLREA
ncbi:MAG: ATP-dependent helicase [Mycobacteriaceae bacterium]|nr:ATP-dependent helicase [Mycobacteriaceae bacterium]